MSLESIRLRRNSRLQSAAANNPSMRNGETSEGVETLQQALIDIGFAMPLSTRKTGLPDGIYGNETRSVVQKFQVREHLFADGIAGAETLGRLDQILLVIEVKARAQERTDVIASPPLRKYDGS